MAAIDTFILYVATPHLRGTFSATVSEISWVSTSYAVSSMICMLLSGWLCNKYGRKRVYQSALMVFIVGSALCGTAMTLEFLVFSRIIQGVGAGILLPVENVILRRTFPPSQHGLVMGIYGTTIMIGPAFGPIIGGFIIDHYHWPLIFLVNIPIGLISLIMVQHFVKDDEVVGAARVDYQSSNQNRDAPVDAFGILLLVLGMFSLIWLLERGDRLYWFHAPSNVILLFLACFSLSLFVAHELMVKRPAVDLRVLANVTFSTATFLNFLMGFMVSATLFILPIYMQESLDFTATKAGTAMAPRALVMMLVFPITGYLFNRVPPKALIVSGLLLGFYSAFLMSHFTHETGWHDMILPQILQGAAVALVLTPLSTVALMGIKTDRLPAAAGFDSMSRQIGGSLGIAVFATLLAHYQQVSWELLRHKVSMAYPLLFKRFDGVLNFFLTLTPSRSYAYEQSLRLLNARVEEQMASLTYMNLFQIIALCFAVMAVIAMLSKLKRSKVS